MAIHHAAIDRALKRARDWQRTATKKEILAFLQKANPPVPGLDPPLKLPKPKVRRSTGKKSNRGKK